MSINVRDIKTIVSIIGKTYFSSNIPDAYADDLIDLHSLYYSGNAPGNEKILEVPNEYEIVDDQYIYPTYKINTIIVANTGTSTATVSVGVVDANNNVAHLVYKIQIPVNSSQIISTKETYFYLERDSSQIRACKDSGDSVSIVISYEELWAQLIPT